MLKNYLKKYIWDGLGVNLGAVWDTLGRPLATFGCILAVFWACGAGLGGSWVSFCRF